MNQTLIDNLNAKQLRAVNRLNAKIEEKAKVDAHNKKAIQQIIVDEHNKRAIAFFNSQKVETSTKSSRWRN